jgi:hypothetical protein
VRIFSKRNVPIRHLKFSVDKFFLVTCAALCSKVIHFKSLKVHNYLFRPLWSSSVVKISGPGNCCLLLLLMLLIKVYWMRICVWVGGLCSLLLCVVLLVLFSNAYKSSRCACVFELVGCVLSCCVLCCMSCSRMHMSPLDAHACLSWWVVFSLVVCCAACLVLEYI